MGIFRFGIPSIDKLLGGVASSSNIGIDDYGVYLPERSSCTSVCIIGPEGTGKSVLSLHLASRYLADNSGKTCGTKALYFSTDLSYPKAKQVWDNFDLSRPELRKNPFDKEYTSQNGNGRETNVSIKSRSPIGGDNGLAFYLSTADECELAFVDFAESTAGDDWGYLNRVLASLPKLEQGAAPHLLIIDAVEGFETLVGEFDAFGEALSRRSRIAQVMRLAAKKCHVVFIVEEPRVGTRVPEEFVTDVVIRLRADQVRHYSRRTIEIEKVRGQTHARGQHAFTMRKGSGSTTGRGQKQPYFENPDDPKVTMAEPSGDSQGYVLAFPSLHLQSRDLMETLEKQEEQVRAECAGFGIRYLDDMLVDYTEQPGLDRRYTHGLPLATVTALIGDPDTQKTGLGHSFLAETFGRLTESERRARDNGTGVVGKQTPEQIAAHIKAALKEVGVAVLLTTQDTDASLLAKEFARWHSEILDRSIRDEWRIALEQVLVQRIVCRRLEIHDMPAPIIFHVIKQCIEGARSRITINGGDQSRIRLVIEDFSTWKEIYPEIHDDPLFLPFLLLYLRRAQITTLVIDTHPARPGTRITDPFDNELRSLVDHQLYTWRVPFYGESRIAIAAIPPLSKDLRSVVRELKWSPAERNHGRPEVDPHFESYTGLEQGRPEPIPLDIRLFAETESFRKYIEDEEFLFRERFTPFSGTGQKEDSCVIRGVPTERFEILRECGARRDTRLDSTLVCQIDEFWYLHNEGALRGEQIYLNATTLRNGESDLTVDPLQVFRPTIGSTTKGGMQQLRSLDFRRLDFFRPIGYSLRQLPESVESGAHEDIDRVPFSWDFGFLMCDLQAWQKSLNLKIPCHPREPPKTVRDVWEKLPKAYGGDDAPFESGRTHVITGGRPKWRDFLGACKTIASTGVAGRATAFDLELVTAESLSCLILEIWASESWDSLSRKIEQATNSEERKNCEVYLASFQCEMARRSWPRGDTRLTYPLKIHKEDLFKTWLLIGDVLDVATCADAGKPFDSMSRPAKGEAIAVRHWYKTACEWAGEHPRSMVPVGLPGHFSTRGDWFLGVANASRSMRLADRALDLLSSRRANFTRLQRGLGLPTRDITGEGNEDRIRTGLRSPSENAAESGKLRNVTYADLIALGEVTEQEFFWCWRSSLKDYDLLDRIWQKWITRMILAWNELRENRGDRWISGFEIYDLMNVHGIGFKETADADWEREDSISHAHYEESCKKFDRMIEILITLLNEASPVSERRQTQ